MRKAFKSVIENGIWFGGRHFEFLCFSASQLRESKCYFFSSPSEGISAATLRAWMGDFSSVKGLAKVAARLGQAFSHTIPTIEVWIQPEIPLLVIFLGTKGGY